MDLKIIRFIDGVIGYFLCVLANIHNKFKKSSSNKSGKIEKKDVKNILVIKMWGIGSIIQASPTLKALRKNFPNSKITFFTMQSNKGVYEGSKLVDELVYFEIKKLYKITLDFFKLILKLRKKKFDLVIDLEPFAYFSAIVTYLTNAKIKVSFFMQEKNIRNSLYTIKDLLVGNCHVRKLYTKLLEPLGIITKDYSLEKIYVSNEDKAFVDDLFRKENLTKENFIIAINISGGDFAVARRWQKEKFAQLADKIFDSHKKYEPRFLFVGIKKDKRLINKTISFMDNKDSAINLAGKTNLKQLAYLFTKCRFLITNDSGPLHVATAMDVPTFSFFGPETPNVYGPIGKKHIVFYKNLWCSPCISFLNAKEVRCKTDDAECMRRISVEEVYNTLKPFLHKS